ncbi:ABC transporter ATP-binding protein [Patescibacteria group bacterium]|nr:MAG: ABC transporter ATP-binding protein [Patescibacteria group bacterium]
MMGNDNIPAVIAKDLYKSFKLPNEQASGIKQLIINRLRSKKGYEVQHVLNDVSFEIKKGEFFGIVGRNGSGKSTLLKMLAGIYTPDKGSVILNGTLTPFIELGVGFNPELTGRENVFLNGALLGFSKDEMEHMYHDIVEFAELERFMDQKLKNYSSGMQVRLAFSIATHADTDILIFDEVLAVGDSNFQQKCLDVFRKLKKQGKTIILVSHSTGDIEKFCDRVLVVDKGRSLGVMDPGEAIAIYQRLNIDDNDSDPVVSSTFKKRWGNGRVRIKKIIVKSENSPELDSSQVNFGDGVRIEMHLKRKEPSGNLPITAGLGFFDQDDVNMAGPNSSDQHIVLPDGKSEAVVSFIIKDMIFNEGKYDITAAVFDENSDKTYDHIIDAQSFDVIDKKIRYGKVSLPNTKWEVTTGKVDAKSKENH